MVAACRCGAGHAECATPVVEPHGRKYAGADLAVDRLRQPRASSDVQTLRQPFTGPTPDLHQLDFESDGGEGRLRVMEEKLRYDMMLEVDGVLRSQDVRVELDREVQPGETINMRDGAWLVTEVTAAEPNHGLDRRLIAREV
jgi:hypothetical protein